MHRIIVPSARATEVAAPRIFCRRLCRPSPAAAAADNNLVATASSSSTTMTTTTTHYPPRRSISTTPFLQLALPAANKKKTASETPKASQKKVNKEKKGPSASKLEKSASAESRIESLLIKAYDAPSLLPPAPSTEEAALRYNIGRNYVIGSFRRHNEMYHDLAVKIRMKKYALQLLPRETYDLGDTTISSADGGGSDAKGSSRSVYAQWKSNALKYNPNGWGPPDHRHVPMYTPPIEGFDINLYADKEDEDK
jgi:hypothetical protein